MPAYARSTSFEDGRVKLMERFWCGECGAVTLVCGTEVPLLENAGWRCVRSPCPDSASIAKFTVHGFVLHAPVGRLDRSDMSSPSGNCGCLVGGESFHSTG